MLADVRECLNAVEGYEGPISELARQAGLRTATLRLCRRLILLGDSNLYKAVWEGHLPLQLACRLATGLPVKPYLTPAQRRANIRSGMDVPEVRDKMSTSMKAHWAKPPHSPS